MEIGRLNLVRVHWDYAVRNFAEAGLAVRQKNNLLPFRGGVNISVKP